MSNALRQMDTVEDARVVMRPNSAMRFLRSAQTHFPAIRTAKFGAYNFGMRHFGWRIPPEFKILDRLGPIGLALDIGGNWGQSILALKRCARPEKIVSFEPNRDLAIRLQVQFEADPSVEVRPHALSDRPGRFELYVPRYRNYVYDGLASLKQQEALEWLNEERMMGFDRSKLSVERQDVVVERLDALDLAPDVVKIDVQGAEELVVRGGMQMFAACRPLTIIEAPSASLVEVMADFGLAAFTSDGRNLTSGFEEGADVVFASDEHLRRIQGA
ncbi:FkbM family methyltransferase [Parapontixanthobacter aurantiacus]|nr:FkbM family methyltransferase [Parapontixanthobacter aurantiacus]